MSVVMCPKHNRLAMPSYAKRGRTRCATCQKESRKKGREKRVARWRTEFISCIRHVERRCNLGQYAYSGKRRCASCCVHRPDGTSKPARKRQNYRGGLKSNLKHSIRNRASGGRVLLQGLKLFERITGVNYATQI